MLAFKVSGNGRERGLLIIRGFILELESSVERCGEEY
jgi:hypothetical protein